MAKSLPAYADWLDSRDELIWPKPPEPKPLDKVTPYLKPIYGLRAVTWSVYGTLLCIADGRLVQTHPQELRMHVAMDKTIHEFNMWTSMIRKPGPPWKSLLPRYEDALKNMQLLTARPKGDAPQINSAELWRTMIGQLEQKDYEYDESFYGTPEQLAEKVAFFYHSALQGVGGTPKALETMLAVTGAGMMQGLLADAQPFTLVQLLRGLRTQGTLPPLRNLILPELTTLSYKEGVCKPSKSLYATAIARFKKVGIEPKDVLHIGSRLRSDLAVAKQFGMRTALYAGDSASFQAKPEELRDKAMKPDRLIADLGQVREILGI